MSTSRKNNLFRTSLGDTAITGGGTIFTYPIPDDTSILAEAKLIAHDRTNEPASLGSATFVSTAGVRRLGTGAAALIGTGNHALIAEVDAAIAGGSPGLSWAASGNNLILQFTTTSIAPDMFYLCQITLYIT